MKKIAVLFVFAVASGLAFAQGDATICHTSPMEKFSVMAANKDFNSSAAHQKPRTYVHVTQAGGKMVSFKTPDGKEAKGYLLEAKNKTNNWIFVFQEWWGLNDNIKRQAEQLFTDMGNANVFALDMYDGIVTADPAVARKLFTEFKQDRGDAIVKGALDYAGKNAKVGTIGWCFGGTQSLMAALTLGKHASGCVMYYGMPVDDVETLKKLNTDVLGIFAAKEKYITQDIVKKFETNMKAAGKNITVKNYDAEHGFANPSNAIYDKASTEDAYKHTLAFFRERLK
ncbi:MAG TPA: dienelactone hydrolase family protein [Chryseosolibacter sp.]